MDAASNSALPYQTRKDQNVAAHMGQSLVME